MEKIKCFDCNEIIEIEDVDSYLKKQKEGKGHKVYSWDYCDKCKLNIEKEIGRMHDELKKKHGRR